MRAMASLMVMKESSKWRSGRVCEPTAWRLRDALGGKMPEAFAHHEGIAAQNDCDVMIESGK